MRAREATKAPCTRRRLAGALLPSYRFKRADEDVARFVEGQEVAAHFAIVVVQEDVEPFDRLPPVEGARVRASSGDARSGVDAVSSDRIDANGNRTVLVVLDRPPLSVGCSGKHKIDDGLRTGDGRLVVPYTGDVGQGDAAGGGRCALSPDGGGVGHNEGGKEEEGPVHRRTS